MDQPLRKSSFDLQGLLACARGELFGPGNPQLPMPPMLMFDRITTINDNGGADGKGEIIAEFDIHPDLWFFKCHFEGDPVMPGCLGLPEVDTVKSSQYSRRQMQTGSSFPVQVFAS